MLEVERLFDFIPTGPNELCWEVPTLFSYCEGHFPGRPIVPAIAILDGSLAGIRRVGELPRAEVASIKSAKFIKLLTPGMKVRLRFTFEQDLWRVEWFDGDEILSELCIALR